MAAHELRADLHATFLTSGLTDDQLTELVAAGQELPFEEGDELWHEGEPADYLWVLLDGSIQMSRQVRGGTIAVGTLTTPGQWAGGLRAWGDESHSAGYRATGHAVSPGRIFRLPSADLRRLVASWFPFGRHIIEGLYNTVRSIDATARQSESLVALGTLSAGLAHELNNPAAASLRAVEQLRSAAEALLSSLADMAAAAITADQYVELDHLRLDLSTRPSPVEGAVARTDREDALGAWLDRHGIERGWELTPPFAAAGADPAWFDQIEAAVGAAATGAALRWASTILTARALLDDLADSSNRISNLVAAVKSYSQMDRAPRQLVDIHEGIESTLVMMSPKLHDVDVRKNFDPGIPTIEVYPAELNQLWTNLIDNAIDAMDGVGTLTISSRRDRDDLVIDISDTGHGMDADVQARVFEPFFTTKDVSKGTGLGLDISRRIVVERHNGEITFDSRPGATTAHVRLPM